MLTQFDPVKFSRQECDFLIRNLGKPSVVALKEIKGIVNPAAQRGVDGRIKDTNPVIYPDGVVPANVKPVLDGIYELIELEKHEGLKWVGIEAVKTALNTWVREDSKWEEAYNRTRGRAPRYPSLYAWDARGQGHWAGAGSDSGQVKTYFGPAGERIPFQIDLIYEARQDWTPPVAEDRQFKSALFLDDKAHRIECRVPNPDGTFCGHTENYKPDSRASYNAARARMSKHLRKATVEADAHRELHTLEFNR